MIPPVIPPVIPPEAKEKENPEKVMTSGISPDKKQELADDYKDEKKRRTRKRKKKEPEYILDPTLFNSFVNFPFNYLAERKHNSKWKLTKEETGQLAGLTMVVFKKHIPKLGAYQEEYALGALLALLIAARYNLPEEKETEKPK